MRGGGPRRPRRSLTDDTIVAVATPPGEGGVAIVRLSGPLSQAILGSVFRPRRKQEGWESHRLVLGYVQAEWDPAPLDEGLAVFMQGPRSYTGEDVVEFHVHGGGVVAGEVVMCCVRAGARLAEPGEFTLRAFLNGRLDLAQAEGVLGVIQARTAAGLRLAAGTLVGRFSERVSRLRESLLDWMSLLEAEIDFGDEVPELSVDENRARLAEARALIEELLEGGQAGRLVSEGVRTVLVGPPNAGKSTLLNALMGEERALVTPIPGTTRDRLEERVVVDGVLLHLVDTAGLRGETSDPVEKLGIERSLEALEQAELVVYVLDGSCPWPSDFPVVPHEAARVVLLNKRDLGSAVSVEEASRRLKTGSCVELALVDGEGPVRAAMAIAGAARSLTGTRAECFSVTQRHLEALARCGECLTRVQETVDSGFSAEFLCLDLRQACEALGEVLGLDVTEEVLDRIFSSFCLGK